MKDVKPAENESGSWCVRDMESMRPTRSVVDTPSLAAVASRANDKLQGVISFHEDAIPIWGLVKSASPMPTARSMPRAAARSSPSVTSRLRGFRSGFVAIQIRLGHHDVLEGRTLLPAAYLGRNKG